MHMLIAMNHSSARKVRTVPNMCQLTASAIRSDIAKIAITGR